MKLFDGVDATVILSMVEYWYAVVEVSVSSMECCECIVDLEGDVMCVCVWPPVSGELLSSMRYLSLVLTFMTSLHTLRLGSTPPLVSLGSLLGDVM